MSALVATATAVGLSACWATIRLVRCAARVKPLGIPYVKKTSAFFVAFSWLPKPLRHRIIVAMNTPKMPKDCVDVQGDSQDPYKFVELVEGAVWRVRYRFISDPKETGPFFEAIGVDMRDAASILRHAPKKMRPILERDGRLFERFSGGADGEDLLAAGFEENQDMLVARLGGDGGGGLLLYNPCRMRGPVVRWLAALGPVEWIVSGSSLHTNQMPQAAAAHPAARVLCSSAAGAKCASVGMGPAAANYDVADERMGNCREELARGGVVLHHVAGDVNQALFVVAHGHLFECDMLYGSADGKQLFNVSNREEWETKECGNCAMKRLIFYAGIVKGASVNGYLPDYRYKCMDPADALSYIVPDRPEADGSSCIKMAESLRKILGGIEGVEFVDSAHSQQMSFDEFKRCINISWNWLDGKSLLPG